MSTLHWLALTITPGIGGATTRKMLERFGDVESIFEASPDELAAIPRISSEVAERLLAIPFDQLEAEILSLDEEGIDLLTWEDDRFPPRLRALNDAPLVLFVRGAILPEDERAVAIVGTRHPTLPARQRAMILARELADRGLTIVSGLAEGIDTAGHQGALESSGGRTLAVLGSGIRVIHPSSNRELAERIAYHGAVISELHPNTPPRGPQLMARDRLVSALSEGVIVIEASTGSGSLDTVARGQKQGRRIFAIPGSAGTDALIQSGAQSLDPEMIDYDSLAALITSFKIPKPLREPKQGRLF